MDNDNVTRVGFASVSEPANIRTCLGKLPGRRQRVLAVCFRRRGGGSGEGCVASAAGPEAFWAQRVWVEPESEDRVMGQVRDEVGTFTGGSDVIVIRLMEEPITAPRLSTHYLRATC